MLPQRRADNDSNNLCEARISAFTWRMSSRSIARSPPFQALREARALPSVVRGPVDRSHGFQRRISAAWLDLRADVHPFMRSLQ